MEQLHRCSVCKDEFKPESMADQFVCKICSPTLDVCPTCKTNHRIINTDEQSYCYQCGSTFPTKLFDRQIFMFEDKPMKLCSKKDCNRIMSFIQFFINDNRMFVEMLCKKCGEQEFIELNFKTL